MALTFPKLFDLVLPGLDRLDEAVDEREMVFLNRWGFHHHGNVPWVCDGTPLRIHLPAHWLDQANRSFRLEGATYRSFSDRALVVEPCCTRHGMRYYFSHAPRQDLEDPT